MGLQADGRRTISYSEIAAFQRCQYQHHLGYVEGYKKVRTEVGASALGTVVHVAIAAALLWYHNNDYKDDKDAVLAVILDVVRRWSDENKPDSPIIVDEDGLLVDFSEAEQEWIRSVDEAAAIAYRTVMHLDIPTNWRTVVDSSGIPLIEYRLEHPIGDNYDYVGVIDWVATDINRGITYIVDWKTRRNFQDDENAYLSGEDFNVQLSLYQYALNDRGANVQGSIIYQISSRLPEIPDLTKQGRVSKAKIKSDWPTYRQAVIDYGLDPDDYLDMKEQLDAIEFWRPVTHYRGQKEITSRWVTMLGWAKLIAEYDGEPLKNENVTCVFCPFAQICLAEDKGFDVQYMIEDRYTKRENSHGSDDGNKSDIQ